MSASKIQTADTALAPFAVAPGVIPAAYSVFVAAGILLGVSLVAVLAAMLGESGRSTLQVSAGAVIAGILGAKLWYVIGHRGKRFNGWCIQGFVSGAGLVAILLGSAWLAFPVGEYLDMVAPGLLVGMGIGRVGCFFAGCCRGRPTTSRWGVWSSDQRVGARRVPTQLFEAALAMFVGVAAFVATARQIWPAPGAVFVAAIALYTLGRQFLLPLRADPRHFQGGRWIVIASASLVLISDAVWIVGAR